MIFENNVYQIASSYQFLKRFFLIMFFSNQQYNATAIFCFTKSYFNKNLPGYHFIQHFWLLFFAAFHPKKRRTLIFLMQLRGHIWSWSKAKPQRYDYVRVTITNQLSVTRCHYGLPHDLLWAFLISYIIQGLFSKYISSPNLTSNRLNGNLLF